MISKSIKKSFFNELNGFEGNEISKRVGLVWSGGYGVQRKVAGAEQVLRSTAEVAGMGLMGLGGLIAIIGGLLFVVVVIQAIRNTPASAGQSQTIQR